MAIRATSGGTVNPWYRHLIMTMTTSSDIFYHERPTIARHSLATDVIRNLSPCYAITLVSRIALQSPRPRRLQRIHPTRNAFDGFSENALQSRVYARMEMARLAVALLRAIGSVRVDSPLRVWVYVARRSAIPAAFLRAERVHPLRAHWQLAADVLDA